MADSNKDKNAQKPTPDARGEKDKIEAQEHRERIRQELEETKREKKKVFGFQGKLKKRFDFRKKAMFGGKFTHGTRGKPTHGPRGNQG